MKVLHLVGGDLLSGGAARGAYWLHRGLLEHEIHTRLLTPSITDLGDDTVISIANDIKGKTGNLLRNAADVVPILLYPKRKDAIFSTGFAGYDFTKTSAYAKATIIHLHWINGGFVSMRHLHKVDKPIVWTLRDMWPMTGGCHIAYALNCCRYIESCGRCPQLNSNSKHDLSRLVLSSKRKLLPDSIKVVGISNWISEQAKESSLFKSHDVRTIFNNIDTRVFSPVEKAVARAILGIQTDKKIILVGAHTLSIFYKDFDKFLEAARSLDKDKYHLCVFGNVNHQLITDLGFSFNSFGYLHDTITLRLVYSAADLFVAPSLMESFGKTMAEAMACGTPVVCFDATGPRDIVDHKTNGYRAIPFEAEDLAAGIEWVCRNQHSLNLAQSARNKIVDTFDCGIIAEQYIQLYRTIS